jgi:hypothetical protein
MSSELALTEKCPEVEGAPPRKERVAEIKDINHRISADSVLEHMSQAFNYTEMYIYEKAKYFLIEYDRKNSKVKNRPYTSSISGTEALDNIEAEVRLDSSLNAVLVEAGKIEVLKLAYPNYFGDVHVFRENLKRITKGKEAVQYKLPPQQTVPPPPKEVPDTAWFRKRPYRWPKDA